MASKRGRSKKRQHTYRGARTKPGLMFTGSHKCPECGKWCYPTRDDAEQAVRSMHPGATVHFYKCQLSPQAWWHFTSMTAEQVAGIRERESRPARGPAPDLVLADEVAERAVEEPPEETAV